MSDVFLAVGPRHAQSPGDAFSFRPLAPGDLPLLHAWMQRPHVRAWWPAPAQRAEFDEEFLPLTDPRAATRGHIALLDGRPIGFIQSYVVKGCGEGWWEDETDPGARGIDQFLAHVEDLGRGLGARMIRAFVDELFRDPAVTKVQTDPAPHNARAIRCYTRAGFVAEREIITPDGPALLMVRRRAAKNSEEGRE